jgi:hypothetical protein
VATTPIWVPLVVALLGLGGILLTQRRADRREDARWQREREREQALWAREDAARSYEQRREAYVAFIKEFQRLWHELTSVAITRGLADFDPSFDYLDSLYERLVQIQIFGTDEAANLAYAAYRTLSGGVFGRKKIPNDVLGPLQSEIRRDLSIADRPHEPPAA